MTRSNRALLQELHELFGDHSEIADLTSRVREAIERADKHLARALLLALQGLEEAHYRGEEALMEQVGYDEFTRHHEEHLHLIEALHYINRTLALEDGGTVSVMIAAHLEETVAHTREADARLGIFLERLAFGD